MLDWLEKYLTDDGFEFSRLINDDFFEPLRLVFQNRHYVSTVKLLVIAIDSIGFIEFGDTKQPPFIKWLEEYADLDKVGITPRELWEQRNSLLHMSSLNSRQVNLGKVRKLVAYVGKIPDEVTLGDDIGYYDLQALIYAFAQASNRWVDTYLQNPEKIMKFAERYDLTVSDSRMLEFQIEKS
jgi:hypothetical protein